MSYEDFDLPPNMQEATPNDVQGVLDAIDVLLISGGTLSEDTTALPEPVEPDDFHGVSAETLRHVVEGYMRRNRISLEQLAEMGRAEKIYNLSPVEDLELFLVKRYPEFRFTQGIIIRRPIGGKTTAAHIHNYKDSRGLRIDFDNQELSSYEEPEAQTATIADCEELIRQLGMTSVLSE